ncbi:hypothetical protein PISMIDRAFT_5805 [Pisolithus microcarpus 441]|uniref:RING-type domain-containing protein n=1 Tax=Pisolithus microcarpus 441 TaxID=765257 RepID=A0A0C9ZZC9_9AGAM|nr:hypothetical protein PISMIDRAFT_5805 [Pisolithus microcarpus 441]
MPAVRSRTQTPRRSQRTYKPEPTPAPSAPSTIKTCCSDDLYQKIAQVLELFEGEVETRAAEEARVAAEEAKTDAQAAEERVRKRVQLFTTVHAKAVRCHMCARCMDRPFILVECGHTFCYGCLRIWFQRCLLEQVGWQDIPAHLKEAPMTAAKLRELFEDKHIYMTWYTCPIVTCQVSVERKPIEVDVAKHMIGAVNNILGVPACQVNSNPILPHQANIWADIFYEENKSTIIRTPFIT